MPVSCGLMVSLCQGAVERVKAAYKVHKSTGETITPATWQAADPLAFVVRPQGIKEVRKIVFTSFYAFHLESDPSVNSESNKKWDIAKKAGSIVFAFLCAKTNEEALGKIFGGPQLSGLHHHHHSCSCHFKLNRRQPTVSSTACHSEVRQRLCQGCSQILNRQLWKQGKG